MRYNVLTAIGVLIGVDVFTQNCEAFLYYGDTLQYKACIVAEERQGYYQYSAEYQEALDNAIEVCPYFSHAYRHKSVAYLKSGDFITWKKLIDKAVEYNWQEYLGIRAWCRFQFFNDYQGIIADVELLESKADFNIGYSVNGTYHLTVAKALAYKMINEKEKAISILETYLDQQPEFTGYHDLLHLGVLYYEVDSVNLAIETFNQQIPINETAELYYYRALSHLKLGKQKDAKKDLEKSLKLFQKGTSLYDPYVEMVDQIYLQNIETALQQITQ